MPYIITTTIPLTETIRHGRTEDVTRRAVTTLDEAREAIKQYADDTYAYRGRYHADADAITAEGGKLGPLPDGTMIEVRPYTEGDALLPGQTCSACGAEHPYTDCDDVEDDA